MRTSTSPFRSLPDAADFCPGCGRLSCHCDPDPEYGASYGRAYAAGYAACAHDGFDQRPMTEHVVRLASRVVRDPATGRAVHVMTPVYFVALSWRRSFATEAAYASWFLRTYGFDLGPYLAGYDDAGAGLPSAVDDPGAHAEAARALDGYADPDPGPASA